MRQVGMGSKEGKEMGRGWKEEAIAAGMLQSGTDKSGFNTRGQTFPHFTSS